MQIRCRLISRTEDLDYLLDLYKTHLGLDLCDTFGDRKARLLDLPAAVAYVERKTAISIARSVYEITGSRSWRSVNENGLCCEIRLPHPPIYAIDCFEWNNAGNWEPVPEDCYTLERSLNPRGRSTVRQAKKFPWCECPCNPICHCDDCPTDMWRLRYSTGCGPNFLLGQGGMLIRAVLYAAEWLDTGDSGLMTTLDRLITCTKQHAVAGC